MKKVTLNLTGLVMLLAVFFTACDKDVETSELELNKDKVATINGYLFSQLDLTSAGMETVPAETPVLIRIANSNFLNGASGAYADTVFTDANGAFTAVVPADDDGVNVVLSPLPFEYEQVQPLGGYENTVRKIYSVNPVNLFVSAGDLKIQQIYYNADNFGNYVPMAEISGEIFAETNSANAGTELLEKSITIEFTANGWAETVTTNTDGSYSVVVPQNTEIYISSNFVATNFTGGSNEEYEYELNTYYLGSFGGNIEDVTIDFGMGNEVE